MCSSDLKHKILGIDPGTNIMGYALLNTELNKSEVEVLSVLQMSKLGNPYAKLKFIYEKINGLIEQYHPDVLAIEAPFYGKNVQSMLKLGRAQGVAIAAAMQRDIPIHEYAPLKIKMAITGNGQASKPQVADMLRRMLHIDKEEMPKYMDATDALGAAYCHFMQMGRPESDKHFSSWKDFANKNKERVKGQIG